MSTATKITYMYRDAGNYKFRGDFIVSGVITKNCIEKFLIDERFFIPKLIGLPSLIPAIRNDDDHDFHEFDTFELCNSPALLQKAAFIRRLKAAHEAGW